MFVLYKVHEIINIARNIELAVLIVLINNSNVDNHFFLIKNILTAKLQ